MTNNLKIFISTGYFCFSSTSVKNQIISNNNNDEKDNKNSKDVSKINNKDEKKIKIKNKKNTSWLIYVILLIIIVVVVIAVIVIFVVNKIFVVKEFKFNKEDFAKENFCPTFFLIKTPKIIEESGKRNKKFLCINDFKENADSFFEILARFVFFDVQHDDYYNNFFNNNKEKVIYIYFNCNNSKLFASHNSLMIDFSKILEEINDFALYSENASNDEILANLKEEKDDILQKIENFKKIFKEKYSSNRVLFNSYLYSYLLLYLFETFKNKDDNIKIVIHKSINREIRLNNQRVNYNYMYEILKNLVCDKFPYKDYDNKKLIINYNEQSEIKNKYIDIDFKGNAD